MARRSYWRELNAGVATASEAGAVADVDAGLGDKARRNLQCGPKTRYRCTNGIPYRLSNKASVDTPDTNERKASRQIFRETVHGGTQRPRLAALTVAGTA